MSTVATVDLDITAASSVERMEAIERWLDSADVAECLEAKQRASIIRHACKALEGAAAMRIAASRVEAVAMRRLFNLGHLLKGGPGTLQRWIGTLTEDRFGEVLDALADNSIHSLHREDKNKAATENLEDDIWRGAGMDYPPVDVSEMRRLAAAILQDVMASDRPTSMRDMAEDLADQIMPPLATANMRDVAVIAATGVIRQAIREDAEANPPPADGYRVPAPRVITVFTDAGWLRVPRIAATVGQLTEMAAYRTKQAHELMGEANRLQRIATWYQAIADGNANMKLAEAYNIWDGPSRGKHPSVPRWHPDDIQGPLTDDVSGAAA